MCLRCYTRTLWHGNCHWHLPDVVRGGFCTNIGFDFSSGVWAYFIHLVFKVSPQKVIKNWFLVKMRFPEIRPTALVLGLSHRNSVPSYWKQNGPIWREACKLRVLPHDRMRKGLPWLLALVIIGWHSSTNYSYSRHRETHCNFESGR